MFLVVYETWWTLTVKVFSCRQFIVVKLYRVELLTKTLVFTRKMVTEKNTFI